jgi:hypothetical protein
LGGRAAGGDCDGPPEVLQRTREAKLPRVTLAQIALREESDDEAARLLLETLALAHEVGYRDVRAFCLLRFAGLALKWGDAHSAARLCGCADAILESVGIKRLQDDEHALREQLLTGIEQAFGADRARAALEDGWNAPPDLVDDALRALVGGRE